MEISDSEPEEQGKGRAKVQAQPSTHMKRIVHVIWPGNEGDVNFSLTICIKVLMHLLSLTTLI